MNLPLPRDGQAPRYPVSIKGVVIHENKILLLKNEREEWELPGGKLEPQETLEDCLIREIKEETNLLVTVGQFLKPYIYNISNMIPVLILPFHCRCENFDGICLSHEHKEIDTFNVLYLDRINLPIGYRDTIRAALELPLIR